jgi:hypothetical protein
MYFLVKDQGNKDTQNMLYILRFCSFSYLTYHKLYHRHKAIDFSLTLQSHIDRSLGYLALIYCFRRDINNIAYTKLMSTERKNPLKRDQALNDATSGQLGEEPRLEPSRRPSESETDNNIRDSRIRTARKMSRDM